MRIIIKMQSQYLFLFMDDDYHSSNRGQQTLFSVGSVRMVMPFMAFRCCLLSTTPLCVRRFSIAAFPTIRFFPGFRGTILRLG